MKQEIILIFLLTISFLLTIHFTFASSGVISSGVGVVFGTSGSNSTGSGEKCEKDMCGPPGNCTNITGVTYCIDGKISKLRCVANKIEKVKTYKACQNLEIGFNVTDDEGSPNDLDVEITSASGVILSSSPISGLGSFSLANQAVDMKFKFDESKFVFKAKNVDLNKISSRINNIIVDIVNPNIPNVNVYKAYRVELPSDFTFSQILLEANYSDAQIGNEDNITVYKCSSYNPSTNSCNEAWSKFTSITVDKTNKIISLQINSFSVYVFGEQSSSTTTTTTTIPNSTTTTITCTCGSWYNDGCGLSPCSSSQMKMIRTCSPSNCDTQTQCVSSSSCTSQQSPTTTTRPPVTTTTTVPAPIINTNTTQVENTSEEEQTNEEVDGKGTALFILPETSAWVTPLGIFLVGISVGFVIGKVYSTWVPEYHFRPYYSRKVYRKLNQKQLKPKRKEKSVTVLQL
jgi:hypothetical protein